MKPNLLFTLILSICFLPAKSQLGWTQKTNVGGIERSSATSFSVGDYLYAGLGDKYGGSPLNDIWQFDPAKNSWTKKANFPGGARVGVVSFTIGNYAYVGLGWDKSTYYSDLWCYDPSNDTWTKKANFPGAARYFGAGVSNATHGYVGLGSNGSTYYNDFWEYNPASDKWTRKANFGGGNRRQAIKFSIQDDIYFGLGFDGSKYYNDIWVYNPDKNSWTQKNNFKGSGRLGAISFSTGQYAYCGLGYNGTYFGDLWKYDPNSDNWSAMNNFPGGTRMDATACSIRNTGYVGTGYYASTYYNNFWEYKTDDPIINRGMVNSGPFCAGDSIKIPFLNYGAFDTGNYFIAELSDEKGEFDGGQMELGRLKGNKSGTINGLLPKFKFVSSTFYRLRIRSTNPSIFNYYTSDTLRLSIYSIDKADPGPPDTICYKEPIQLKTYGGTQWTWSPKYMMDDSTKRKPTVWPDRDTVYRIIITDKNGCAKTDTGYKKIFVKNRPQLFGDTLLYKCQGKNSILKINPKFTGIKGYKTTWFKNGNWFSDGDSIVYTKDQSEKFTVVLMDYCSPVWDTLNVRVQYLGPLALVPMKDTTLCYGQDIILTAKASGGDSANHKIQWYSKGILLGVGDQKINITQTDTFQAILTDNCSLNQAMEKVIVSVYANNLPPLPINLPDTLAYCGITPLKLKAGTPNNSESYVWTDLNQMKDLGFTDTLSISSKTKLSVSVKNLCGEQSDTLLILSNIKPNLNLDTLYESCDLGSLYLNPGLANNQEKYTWKEILPGQKDLGNNSDITIKHTGTFYAKAENLCGVDSVQFRIILNIKPTADFKAIDVCEGKPVSFTNTSSGAKTFFWGFGDGKTDTLENPKHFYPTTGASHTYQVILKAINSKGCEDSIIQQVNIFGLSNPDFTYTVNGTELQFNPKTTNSTFKFLWIFGDGDSSTLIQPSHRYPKAIKNYRVCLTIQNDEDCDSTQCQSITTGVDGLNEKELSGFKMYPNPSQGIIHLESSVLRDYQIEVFDFTGRKVYLSHAKQMNFTIDLSGKPQGIYHLKISDYNGKSFQAKVLIE